MTCSVRGAFLWLGVVLYAGAPSFAGTVDGFVTNVKSTTAFNVGTLNILIDAKTKCEVKTGYTLNYRAYPFGNIPKAYSDWNISRYVTADISLCDAIHFVNGMRIHLKGTLRNDGQFLAAQAIIYKIVPSATLDGIALIEKAPEVQQTVDGSRGLVWINGYPMTVTPHTTILAYPSNTILRYSLHSNGTLRMDTRTPSDVGVRSTSIVEIKANTWGMYHATRASDGTISVSCLRSWPNEMDEKETKYLAKYRVVSDAPDYGQKLPGRIRLNHGTRVSIIADPVVQKWVTELGMEMVPQYQRTLSGADATKINFHFYIVHGLIPKAENNVINIDGRISQCNIIFTCGDNIGNAPILAMPNGIILIPDYALLGMHSKAQLAALLSYAVTSVVQKQSYIAWPLIKSSRAKMYLVANPGGSSEPFVQSLGVWLNEQVLRIGIHEVLLAGYDIRDAPFAWTAAQGKPINNPVLDAQKLAKKNTTVPWYAAYAFNYISQYYKDVDYSKLKRGRREYQQFLKELYKTDPNLKNPAAQK